MWCGRTACRGDRDAGGIGDDDMNRLMVSRCTACSDVSWPPQSHCSRCMAPMRMAAVSSSGRIRAFSGRDGYFCVAEFDGISIVCSLVGGGMPAVGAEVVFLRHYNDGRDHFEVELAKDACSAQDSEDVNGKDACDEALRDKDVRGEDVVKG